MEEKETVTLLPGQTIIGTKYTKNNYVERLEQENATYKANADAVQKYITQNEQLKTHIDGLEKKNAALKAENERLKSQLDFEVQKKEVFKAENDRLKEENKTLEQFLSKEPLALQALQKGYASYKKSTDVFYEMVKHYKQTLQEIKAIAKQCINKDTCYDCEYCDDCYIEDAEIPTYDVCKLLIQKITKAEEE